MLQKVVTFIRSKIAQHENMIVYKYFNVIKILWMQIFKSANFQEWESF